MSAKSADDETLSHWWSTLGDPVLTSLEERAVKGNLDLRSAQARIRQARAQRDVIRAQRLPTVTASASIEAYNADLGAAQEDLRNVLVSLTAEVALNYVDVRSYQSQLAITKASLALPQETYELTVAQFKSGLATELDAEQARLTLESTRASIPTLETSLQKAANIALRFTPAAAGATGQADQRSFIRKLMPGPPLRTTRTPTTEGAAQAGPRVWVLRDNQPAPVAVKTGSTNGKMTEILSGAIAPGVPLVVESVRTGK